MCLLCCVRRSEHRDCSFLSTLDPRDGAQVVRLGVVSFLSELSCQSVRDILYRFVLKNCKCAYKHTKPLPLRQSFKLCPFHVVGRDQSFAHTKQVLPSEQQISPALGQMFLQKQRTDCILNFSIISSSVILAFFFCLSEDLAPLSTLESPTGAGMGSMTDRV